MLLPDKNLILNWLTSIPMNVHVGTMYNVPVQGFKILHANTTVASIYRLKYLATKQGNKSRQANIRYVYIKPMMQFFS